MKKKSLLLAIAAMSMAAVGVGTVGTFAWYTVDQATAKANGATFSSFLTTNTSVTAGSYEIDFAFKNAAGTADLGEVTLELTDYQGSKLVVGAYNATSGVKRVDATTAAIKEFKLVATWKDGKKPTNADDISYFKGKTLTGAKLLPAGNIKLRSDTTMSSTDIAIPSGGLDVIVTVGSTNDLSLEVSFKNSGSAQNVAALRISTNNPNGAEYYDETDAASNHKYGQTADTHKDDNAVYHHTDSLGVATVNSLTIA